MISALLFVLADAAASAGPAQDEIVRCYAQRTLELRSSTESAPIVADAVIALCADFEPAAQAELFEASVRRVQEVTGGSRAEAERATKSVQDAGWRDWRSGMRSRISANIVQFRVVRPSN